MSARHKYLADLIVEASELSLMRFQSHNDLKLDEKLEGDWVTEADFELQRFITYGIRQRFPYDVVIGEEGSDDFAFEKQETPCWVIDPIDGTANFVNGNPLWGVSIGLVSNGVPILGAISLPALSLGLVGGVNYGLRTLDGQPFNRTSSRAAVFATSAGASSNPQDTLPLATHIAEQGFQPVNYRCGTVGQLFAILGKVSGFIEIKTNYWDIAAGWALAQAAGLEVYGVLEGTPGAQSIEILSQDQPMRRYLTEQP